MPSPNKIIFTVTSLRCGGAERSVTLMANYWANKADKHIQIACFEAENSPFFKVDSRVNLEIIPDPKPRNFFAKILRLIRRIYSLRASILKSKPEIVLANGEFMAVLSYFAALGTGIKILVMEQTVWDEPSVSSFVKYIRGIVYTKVSGVVFLTDKIAHDFASNLRLKKVIVRPNPVQLPAEPPIPITDRPKIITAMGRLVRQKGFDTLIEAYSKISAKIPDWRLEIYGDGPDRATLQAQINQLKLDRQINLMGVSQNTSEVFGCSRLFVLSSRWEAFGNVVVEAMAYGTPVVSFTGLSGPDSVIQNGQNGLLVNAQNCDELATAILKCCLDEKLIENLGKQAIKDAANFSVAAVMQTWESGIFD